MLGSNWGFFCLAEHKIFQLKFLLAQKRTRDEIIWKQHLQHRSVGTDADRKSAMQYCKSQQDGNLVESWAANMVMPTVTTLSFTAAETKRLYFAFIYAESNLFGSKR